LCVCLTNSSVQRIPSGILFGTDMFDCSVHSYLGLKPAAHNSLIPKSTGMGYMLVLQVAHTVHMQEILYTLS